MRYKYFVSRARQALLLVNRQSAVHLKYSFSEVETMNGMIKVLSVLVKPVTLAQQFYSTLRLAMKCEDFLLRKLIETVK